MPKRKALGKGLSALIPEAHRVDETEQGFIQCPVASITPNPLQPRKDFSVEELEEMAASVLERGIITPILVSRTEEGYQLIAGERRWRAAQKAGLMHIPAVLREATPAESLELALIENIHRKDLNPIEEAVAYKKLLGESGVTQDALAKRLGKDRTTITNLLRLLSLSASIQKDVIEGRLSSGHARVLAGLKDREKQAALRERIIKKGLSVRQAEAMAKADRIGRSAKAKRPRPNDYTQYLADQLKRSLGTKVEIRKSGQKGRIIVHFYSDEELDRLLERLT